VDEELKGNEGVCPGGSRVAFPRPANDDRSRRVLGSIRRRLNREFGLALPGIKRSLWIQGETPDQFESAAGFIQSLAEAAPHYRLVLFSSNPATQAWLINKYVNDEVLPAPRNSGPAARLYFRKLRPGLIVFLCPDGHAPRSFMKLARVNSVPVVAPGPATEPPDVRGIIRLLPGSIPCDPPVRQSWRIPTRRDRAGQSRPWKFCASYFMKRRINDWQELRTKLRNPESVLCLGNGPSSEDPRLAGLEHDCLMRVNWRWKRRGFLCDPDVVFVGDAATLHRLPPRVFGLWNISLEYGMLLRHCLTHGLRRMDYFTMERVSPLIRDHDWPARPSNGALMVAAAASLRPARLIIAGLDLFQHPAGRYPDNTRALNQYSRVHTREVDLAILRLALKDYPGELIIFGETLARALEEFQADRQRAGCFGKGISGA